jgi:hypothetical protein
VAYWDCAGFALAIVAEARIKRPAGSVAIDFLLLSARANGLR